MENLRLLCRGHNAFTAHQLKQLHQSRRHGYGYREHGAKFDREFVFQFPKPCLHFRSHLPKPGFRPNSHFLKAVVHFSSHITQSGFQIGFGGEILIHYFNQDFHASFRCSGELVVKSG